jgi:hypothetical protein
MYGKTGEGIAEKAKQKASNVPEATSPITNIATLMVQQTETKPALIVKNEGKKKKIRNGVHSKQ